MASEAEIEQTILELLAAREPGKTISPADAAERVAGPEWRRELWRVRRVAAAMTRRGALVILRKGRPVDPDEMRGVVRLRLP